MEGERERVRAEELKCSCVVEVIGGKLRSFMCVYHKVCLCNCGQLVGFAYGLVVNEADCRRLREYNSVSLRLSPHVQVSIVWINLKEPYNGQLIPRKCYAINLKTNLMSFKSNLRHAANSRDCRPFHSVPVRSFIKLL